MAKSSADQEVERNRAGHYPTVDAVASYAINNGQNFGNQQVDTRTATIGVELNLPIYQGGLTSSRVREAVANLALAAVRGQPLLTVVNGVQP